MKKITTFFERILLMVGIFVAAIGFYAINTIYVATGRTLSYEMLSVVFIWALLLFLIIIASMAENQREEASLIDQELHKETVLMKEMIRDHVLEIKLLRETLANQNLEKQKKRKA
jgi:hypothetical protein